MAFAVRCPECRAKLKLDDRPADFEPIDCPKCDARFTLAEVEADGDDAPPVKKKKAKREKAAGKKKDNTPKAIVGQKRVGMNPLALLGIVGGLMGGLFLAGFGVLWVLGRAGKVEDMIAYLPGDCNLVRGVNMGHINKYPGYKAEKEKHLTAPVKAGIADLAKASGFPETAFEDYMLVGKAIGVTDGAVYVFRTEKYFRPDTYGQALVQAGAREVTAGAGQKAYQFGGKPGNILSNAVVYLPTENHIVICNGRQAADLARKSADGRKKYDENFAGKLNTTGRVVMRGHIWTMIRPTGGMEGYMDSLTKPVDQDFKVIRDKSIKRTLGVWCGFGGNGVRFGAGVECDSSETADGMVTAMKEGPLGKADDSEIPNQMKSAVSGSGNKEFRSFLQYLSFKSKRECAYFTSEMPAETAGSMLQLFNNPTMGEGQR